MEDTSDFEDYLKDPAELQRFKEHFFADTRRMLKEMGFSDAEITELLKSS